MCRSRNNRVIARLSFCWLLVLLLPFCAASATEPIALTRFWPYSDSAVPPEALRESSSTLPARPQPVVTFVCSADLSTTGSSYVGCETSVAGRRALLEQGELAFWARGIGLGGFLEVHLCSGIDRMSRRTAVPLARDQWQEYRIPLERFLDLDGGLPSSGAAPADESYRLRFLVRNIFPGRNGFEIAAVRLLASRTTIRIDCPSETTVPMQRDAVLDVSLLPQMPSEPQAGAASASDSASLLPDALFCSTSAKNELLVPERVAVVNGRARIPLFSRTPGPHTLFLYDPLQAAETSVTVWAMPLGLVVRLSIEEFERQQAIQAPAFVNPHASFEGGTTLPQSALVSAFDHRGRCLLSQLVSMPDLATARARLLIPLPGLIEMRVRAYAEPLAARRSLPEIFPLLVGSRPQDAATTVAVALPEGVTTATVGGYIVALEQPPTTATLLGEDRMTLWAFARVPKEVRLPLTLFGIDHPDLAAMDLVQLGKYLRRLLAWQNRLGPIWIRIPYNLGDIFPSPSAYSWPRVQTLAKEIKEMGLRPVVDVPLPPRSVLQEAVGAEDRATSFAQWLQWLSLYRAAVRERIRIFALGESPEAPVPSTSLDSPELLDLAFQRAYRALALPESTASLVARFSGPFNPTLFDLHLPRAVRHWTEAELVEPYLPMPHASPDANAFARQFALMRHLLRQHDMLKRPLWIGPVAWSSHPRVSSERTQANYLVRLYTMAAAERINRVFWARLRDRSDLPWEGTPEDHTGLLDQSLRPKPAAVACNLALFMLTQTKPREAVTTGALRCFSFDIDLHSMRWPGKLYVAWREPDGPPETLRLPISPAGWYAFDYLGAQLDPIRVERDPAVPLSTDDRDTTKILTFRIGSEPVYIWDVTTIPRKAVHKHTHECDHAHEGPYTNRQ